jgi:hypothetical protein
VGGWVAVIAGISLQRVRRFSVWRLIGAGAVRSALGLTATSLFTLWLALGSAHTQSAPVLGPFPAWPAGALEPAATGPLSETVFNRARPDYDPLGVRMGSFLVGSSLALSGTYDSNVFAVQGSQPGIPVKSDFFVTAIPGLSIKSDWNQDAIGLNMSGAFKKYASLHTEDVNNFQVETSGRYDIANGEYLSSDAIYELLHEDRSSPNSVVTAKNPIEYKVMGGDLAYVRQRGRLGLRVDANITSYDFNNASTASGFTIVENWRDRNEYVLAPRLNYEIQPGYNAFLRVIGNERQYFSQEPGAGPQGQNLRRNSHGWEVDAGTAIEITRITAGEIYVGYTQQYYENPLWKSPAGIAFGGNLIWNVTPITSVKANFSESVAETTLVQASSSLETNVSATVEHELLRNLLLLGSAGFTRDEYQGNPRRDDTFGFDAGARYLMNRNWTATLDLNYSERDSNVFGGSYTRLMAIGSVKYAF